MTAAIDQRHRAFRRFLDLVYSEAGEVDRWNYFNRQRLRENIARHLRGDEIEIVCDPLPPFEPRFRTREHLLQAAESFVARGKAMQGVLRIALIGSILTAAGRQLKGRAGNINRGADVFLAQPDGTYLGRTCPWRECAPGIRTRCQAQNCGSHLYDDLQNLRLPKKLIQTPPPGNLAGDRRSRRDPAGCEAGLWDRDVVEAVIA